MKTRESSDFSWALVVVGVFLLVANSSYEERMRSKASAVVVVSEEAPSLRVRSVIEDSEHPCVPEHIESLFSGYLNEPDDDIANGYATTAVMVGANCTEELLGAGTYWWLDDSRSRATLKNAMTP